MRLLLLLLPGVIACSANDLSRLGRRRPPKSAFGFFTIVTQGNVRLLERFGKYKTTLDPGFHFKIPLVDKARPVTTKEIVLDTPPQNCITADNAPVSADAVVYYRIFDPVLAAYGVANLNLAISNLVKTQIRSEIGKLSLDDTFSARETLGTVLLNSLQEPTDAWGVSITRVEIQEITPRKEILNSMEQVMSAERDKRANILRSEGERLSRSNVAAAEADAAIQEAEAAKKATVLAAEADAAARLLQAEAEADAIVKAAEAEATSTRMAAEATKDALESLASALSGNVEEAAKLEALRQYNEAQASLALSSNAKTIIAPRADEWLAKIGVGLSLGTADGGESKR